MRRKTERASWIRIVPKSWSHRPITTQGALTTPVLHPRLEVQIYVTSWLRGFRVWERASICTQYYGCGLVIPECIENCWILDLGSGSGRDCYILCKLVGENGHVTGIDMTETQVEVAKKYIDHHMNKLNYQNPNVNFILGHIEELGAVGLKDESYNLVISNCVVNLSPDKRAVLREAYRVLKAGGEMYFSDVYASRDLPKGIRKNRILWGECLGGALWWKDLYKIAEDVGFLPPRLVTASQISIHNKELENVVGDCQFVSATFRLFKIPQDDSAQRCEVIYNGGITGHEKELEFDANYKFKQGEVMEVDKETATILQNSRFATKFLICPVGQKKPVPENCSPEKDKIRDPFKLVEQAGARVPKEAMSGCCGSKGCC
ncbi:arsenite methyltransferase isoform X2 [Sphaerodactylus townsendi]|uniref:arsenite methyltransferase isoform X2 n=1 Tax=Sphaerodactylus townsendi TaxID=933632 RepID=UPI002026B003|nr:arsenite methyltransferase isoform X2 [Sphaerodactylus townsendi]